MRGADRTSYSPQDHLLPTLSMSRDANYDLSLLTLMLDSHILVKKNSGLISLQDQRSKGLPTIPSTIAEEMKINPFMRLRLVQSLRL